MSVSVSPTVNSPPGSRDAPVQFLFSAQARPEFTGRKSIAEEKSQTYSIVPRVPGMERSV